MGKIRGFLEREIETDKMALAVSSKKGQLLNGKKGGHENFFVKMCSQNKSDWLSWIFFKTLG
jgi:hypothetical protein